MAKNIQSLEWYYNQAQLYNHQNWRLITKHTGDLEAKYIYTILAVSKAYKNWFKNSITDPPHS
jgi:hypothetical protein